MTNREYIKTQIDALPEGMFAKVDEFIRFQMYSDTTEKLPPLSNTVLEERLQNEISKFTQEKNQLGISVGVVVGGKVLFLNHGNTAVVGGKPVTEDTLFEIGSITKTFTRTLYAYLDTQKVLNGLHTVEQHLGFQVANSPITLFQLLTHTSRLPREVGHEIDTDEKLIEYLRNVQLADPDPKYSGVGMAILGYIIEKKLKKPLDQAMRDLITFDMGMNNTTFALSKEQKLRLAAPHDENSNVTANCVLPKDIKPLERIAGGALISSANDMTRYIASYLFQISVSDYLQRAMNLGLNAGHWPGGKQSVSICWNIHYVSNASGEQKVYHHGGATIGQRSMVAFCPDKKSGIVVLCNHRTDITKLTFGLLEIIIQPA